MAELGIPYRLVGPDSTAIVFGNSFAIKSTPGYFGAIDVDQGIAGLDGEEVRESADELVEAHGGVHGRFFLGRKPVVFNLVVDYDLADSAQIETKIREARRASWAFDRDAVLTWTPSDVGYELRLLLRRNGPLLVAGRKPKTVQIPMVAADPIKRSSTEATVGFTPDQAAGALGYTEPLTDPYLESNTSIGTGTATNLGDLGEAIPRYRITGPITNPEVVNQTTGERTKFSYELGAGEYLDVDHGTKTVLLGGTADRFSAVVFPDSKWWKLAAGQNQIQLVASAWTSGARIDLWWRSTWM